MEWSHFSHAFCGAMRGMGRGGGGIIRKVVRGNLFGGNDPPLQSQAGEMGCVVGQCG